MLTIFAISFILDVWFGSKLFRTIFFVLNSFTNDVYIPNKKEKFKSICTLISNTPFFPRLYCYLIRLHSFPRLEVCSGFTSKVLTLWVSGAFRKPAKTWLLIWKKRDSLIEPDLFSSLSVNPLVIISMNTSNYSFSGCTFSVFFLKYTHYILIFTLWYNLRNKMMVLFV